MRRALRVDPGTLHYMELDEKLAYRVRGLIEAYRRALEDANPRPDQAFMVAALQYLVRDREAALKAARRAVIDGDKDQSVQNLTRLIEKLPRPKVQKPAGAAKTKPASAGTKSYEQMSKPVR